MPLSARFFKVLYPKRGVFVMRSAQRLLYEMNIDTSFRLRLFPLSFIISSFFISYTFMLHPCR